MREPAGLVQKLDNLRKSLAEDTVRNEYVFHRRIHERLFRYRSKQTDVDTLNSWVYAELFKTPESDPWLGLNTPEVYTGITRDGVL